MVDYTGGNPYDQWKDPNSYRRYEEDKTKNWTPGFGEKKTVTIASPSVSNSGYVKSGGSSVNSGFVGSIGGSPSSFDNVCGLLIGIGLVYLAYYIHSLNWFTALLAAGGAWVICVNFLEGLKAILSIATFLAVIGGVYAVVSSKAPQAQGPSAPTAATGSPEVTYATIATLNLSLRTCPTPDNDLCPVIATMPEGLRVKILSKQADGWVEVETFGANGQRFHGYANGTKMTF